MVCTNLAGMVFKFGDLVLALFVRSISCSYNFLSLVYHMYVVGVHPWIIMTMNFKARIFS